LTETTFAWQDMSLSPRERAKKLVEAMTLEPKIVQLHGAMETIDIYAITREAAESGADMDQLAAQIRVERHVKAGGWRAIRGLPLMSGPGHPAFRFRARPGQGVPAQGHTSSSSRLRG
jgi:beta-glucosidase